MKTLLAITLLITSLSAFSTTHIKKGEISPKTGYVITVEEEKNFRKINEDKKILEKLKFVHEEKIELQAKRIENLREFVKDSSPLSKYQKMGYYFLGVLATSTSVYLAGQLK